MATASPLALPRSWLNEAPVWEALLQRMPMTSMIRKAPRPHFWSMKITEDVRKYSAEQGIAEEVALKKGMEEKSKEFVERARKFMRRCRGLCGPAFYQANSSGILPLNNDRHAIERSSCSEKAFGVRPKSSTPAAFLSDFRSAHSTLNTLKASRSSASASFRRAMTHAVPAPLTIVPSTVNAPGNQVLRINRRVATEQKTTTVAPKIHSSKVQRFSHRSLST
jgi:hypothetical protein